MTDSLHAETEARRPTAAGWRRHLDRFSVRGDFWLRVQDAGVGRGPYFFEPIFHAFYSLLFFTLCRSARRGVVNNLSVLLPGSSRIGNHFRALVVFWDFANCLTDAVHCRLGEHVIDWEIEGLSHLESIKDSDEGAVILTAHTGAYDIAAPFFAHQFGRKLNAVRAPELLADTQAHMQSVFREQKSDTFAFYYNTGDKLLGIDLIQAVLRGEFVAIQGDWVFDEISPLTVPVDEDHCFAVPKGPFVLALTTEAPILPLLVVHVGRRRYRVVIEEPFHCRRESRDPGPAVEKAAHRWRDELIPILREHWRQWYLFDSVFSRIEEVEQEAAPPSPDTLVDE